MSGLAVLLEDVLEVSSVGEVATTYPVAFGTEEWIASCDWAERNGLDPMRIPAGSLITRDQFRHRITYVEMVLGSNGQVRVDTDGDPVTRIVVDQHEAGPWPFPAIIAKPEEQS